MRTTPLHARHVAAGARMVEFGGFDMPVWYQGLREEHHAVRTACGVFDVSHMGEVRVTGPEAAASLDRLVTNDMRGLAVGQARYTLMCNESGGVVDDLVVYRLGADDFLVVVNAANREKDFAWMQAHATGDATWTDEGEDWCQLAVQGPGAEALLQPLTDRLLEDIAYYHFDEGTVAGVEGCIVARTGYTGEDGFEIYGPAEAAETLWDAVVAAGAVPAGLGARDTLRLEVRFPLYGHELNDELGPQQAKLMWTVELDKPERFVGQDALEARRNGKTDTHFLCGFEIDGKRIARDGTPVLVDGEEVGWVTSGTRSPTLEKSIGLAYVRRGLGKPGTKLTFDIRGKTAEGTVVKGPFYRRA